MGVSYYGLCGRRKPHYVKEQRTACFCGFSGNCVSTFLFSSLFLTRIPRRQSVAQLNVYYFTVLTGDCGKAFLPLLNVLHCCNCMKTSSISPLPISRPLLLCGKKCSSSCPDCFSLRVKKLCVLPPSESGFYRETLTRFHCLALLCSRMLNVNAVIWFRCRKKMNFVNLVMCRY